MAAFLISLFKTIQIYPTIFFLKIEVSPAATDAPVSMTPGHRQQQDWLLS